MAGQGGWVDLLDRPGGGSVFALTFNVASQREISHNLKS
jgi:hypothetical protein